jgi:hypothetical protein
MLYASQIQDCKPESMRCHYQESEAQFQNSDVTFFVLICVSVEGSVDQIDAWKGWWNSQTRQKAPLFNRIPNPTNQSRAEAISPALGSGLIQYSPSGVAAPPEVSTLYACLHVLAGASFWLPITTHVGAVVTLHFPDVRHVAEVSPRFSSNRTKHLAECLCQRGRRDKVKRLRACMHSWVHVCVCAVVTRASHEDPPQAES